MSAPRDFLVPGGGLRGRLFSSLLTHIEASQPVAAERRRQDLARIGTAIGAYRVLELLGSGGMGAVYLAEHEDPSIRRRVALKVLRDSSVGSAARTLFARERQLVARLTHPNIAQLHDGGETRAGELFYTMEHVRGAAIGAYSAARVATPEGRVRLLLQVVRAIAYAHRNLVVHCDIKPSNVLVTDDGHVKLLDFGIARSLRDDGDGVPPPAAMSLKYAAPEQLRGEPLTAATDVYQLGVLAFGLLTGGVPYAADASDAAAWTRAVVDDEPTSLVQGLDRHAADSLAPRAWPAGTDLRRLRRHLCGDLHAIVRKALAKHPDRRYVSADALAGDLEAWLDRRPVSARRATALYRLRCYVARHRAASATLFVAALLLGVAVQRVRAERDRANAAAETARIEAARAVAAKDFVVGLIRDADPTERPRGANASFGAFLAAVAGRVERALADDATARVEIRLALATSLDRYEGPAQALPQIEHALAEAQTLPPPERARLLPELKALEARERNESGDPAAGERAARSALALTAADADARWALRLRARSALMRSANLQGRDAEAYAIARVILAERSARLGPRGPEVAMDLHNLAYMELYLDRYADAEADYRKAQAMLVDTLGADHPRLAWVQNGLGLVLTKQARYAEAEAAFQQTLAIVRRSFNDADGQQAVRTTLNLGAVAAAQENYALALTRYAEAEKLAGAADPGGNRPRLDALRAAALLGQGDAVRAQALARTAADALAAQNGAQFPLVLKTRALAAYAAFRADRSHAAAAEDELRDVLAALRGSVSATAEERIEVGAWLAELLAARGDATGAQALHDEGLALARDIYGDAHPLTQRAARLAAH